MNERHDSYSYQQGSSGTLRVSDESRWYVIREEWRGSSLLNTVILGSHDTEDEARAAMLQADVMTAAEAAARWNLAHNTIRRAISEGRLQAVKSGGTWLVTAAAMHETYGPSPYELEAENW